MASHNTDRSVGYQLVTKEDKWVVWCVMLLFRARLLTGQSRDLINPVVRLVQDRKRIKKRDIVSARQLLRRHHTNDLVGLIRVEG